MPENPTLKAEREALRTAGDRKTRAITAVFHARRSARATEFFVPPHIARLHGLSPSDLNWALDRLERVVVETVEKRQGKWRILRLLPQYEDAQEVTHTSSRRADNLDPGEERVIFSKDSLRAVTASLTSEPSPDPEVITALRDIAAQKLVNSVLGCNRRPSQRAPLHGGVGSSGGLSGGPA